MRAFSLQDVDRAASGPGDAFHTQPLGFGGTFTDHMAVLEWDGPQGWHDGRICAYSTLPMPPAASVFQYGQAIFEGLKAYRQPDGGVALFRPAENARRFALSAARISMPVVPEGVFVEAVQTLVGVDHRWVPNGAGRSLYVRPFMIATEPTLAVRASKTYLFAVIASPVDSFFPSAIAPISVWLSVDYVRAAPGGTGDVKFAGNYAASLVAQRQAAENGCDQVVWLDAHERVAVEEMGAMNIFFVEGTAAGSRLVTPPLSGTQLAGVTRDSVIQLAVRLGYEVVERQVTVEEWRLRSREGGFSEAFACGTAAVIAPIGQVRSRAAQWSVGDGSTGSVTAQLRSGLLDIQYGTGPDPFGWRHPVTRLDEP